jgi:hypothetical protein
MPEKPSPILGGFATARSKNAADNEAINLAVEIIETKDGKVPGYLFMMSGLILLYTAGNGPIRGMLALNGVLYVVSGNEVYSITNTGVVTALGTVNGDTNPVSMFQNTKQLMILDGIGAWLLPGGYPLTGGTPYLGSLYNVGDTIILQAPNGGTVTAYPEIEVTSISNNPVTGVSLVNAGTTYTGASNVATTPVQPQAGVGKGLTLNLTAVNGSITTFSIGSGGTGYAVNDTGYIIGGGGTGGWFIVTGESGGIVNGVTLLNRGAGYGTTSGAATQAGAPFPPNTGTGFTLITAATSGPISAIGIDNGGQGYQAGNIASINGGTGDATVWVTEVGGYGVITGIEIVSGGAITSPAGAWTQQSTGGSGQNFTLQSPTYGAFLALVPITLPFDLPVAGIVIDGFGLAVFLNQQVIAQSNELDLSTWPALSFGVADQSADNNITIASLHDEAYIFKERNTEVWADQGTSPFAYGPLQGVHIEFGCAAPFSPAKVDNDLIWLARNEQGQGIFIKASAYAPQLVSTQALSNELQKYSNIADCIAYSRQEGGHTYYVATFPSANVTWCYDKTASELAGFAIWTKMAAFDNGVLNRHWGNAFTTWAGGLPAITTTSTYTAQSVEFTSATSLQTATGLNGLPSSFSNAVFSVWLYIADGGGDTGIIFGNQQGGTEPGLQITIQNDAVGAPEISLEAWDASGNPIVTATYDFAAWSNWVNVLISIDTATQQLQVWANTVTSNELVEDQLTAASLTWHSTNPIAALSTTPWSLEIVA